MRLLKRTLTIQRKQKFTICNGSVFPLRSTSASDTIQPLDAFPLLLPVLLVSAEVLSSLLVELIPVVGRGAIYSQSICFNCVFLSAGCSRALPVSKAGQSTSRLQTCSCFMPYA